MLLLKFSDMELSGKVDFHVFMVISEVNSSIKSSTGYLASQNLHRNKPKYMSVFIMKQVFEEQWKTTEKISSHASTPGVQTN